MARSSGMPAYDALYLAGIDVQRGTRMHVWLHPEGVRLHELTTFVRSVFQTKAPHAPAAQGPPQHIVTHIVLRPKQQEHVWVVRMHPTPPVEAEEQHALQVFACWLADVPTLKAVLALLPIEEWPAGQFRVHHLAHHP